MFSKNERYLKLFLILLCAVTLALCLCAGLTGFASADDIDSGEEKFKSGIAPLATKSYLLNDNTGYNADETMLSAFADETYTEISLWVNGGEIKSGEVKNSIDSYGYVTGDVLGEGKTPSVELRLKYNDNSTYNILNTKWQISDDTWKKEINGISGVGVVGTGALLVQKSYTGGSNPDEWKWDNHYGYGDKTSSYHTTDFTTHFKPEHYDGKTHSWITQTETEEGTETVNHESDGWLTIYKPSGEDLQHGVYLKVLFAYEIKFGKSVPDPYTLGLCYTTEYEYKNVLEETTLYLCNGSTEVLFQNLIFTDAVNEEQAEKQAKEQAEEEAEISKVIRSAGTILDGHAANEGFRINSNANKACKIEYRKDGSTNYIETENNALFTAPGRYDFRITPPIGSAVYKTIYINERGIQRNIARYFGDGFITSDSHRIFSDEEIPVFVAGETYYNIAPVDSAHMPLVGKIRLIKGQTVTEISPDSPDYDNEKGGGQYSIKYEYDDVAALTAVESREGWSGKIDKAGEYEAEFVNNPDYYNGKHTGDVYKFVFRFRLTDEKPAPSLNQSLLGNNICFSDYAAGYYGITLQSGGPGTVTYAFPYFSDAYNFAYEYFRTQITKTDGKYVFNGLKYSSQSDVLYIVSRKATDAVVRKYFDASDKSTYLTIKSAAINILSLKLNQDIVVLSDAFNAYTSADGEQFLNDKIYYFTDAHGNVEYYTQPVRFISVADFESNSVLLESEDKSFVVNIDYGAPVESVLRGKNAPGGRYRITEQDVNGNKNIYYAVYVRQGELQTKLTYQRVLNGYENTQSIGIGDSLTRFTANNFILKSAENELDPYGIVKIQKGGSNGYTKIFQLDEVEDYVLDEEGNYVISLVDRLGNSAQFFVDIYTAEKVYNLTVKNNGEVISEYYVSGGQRIVLQTPENEDGNFEFAGWSDGNGNIYGNYFVFNSAQDETLEAVWNYSQTSLEIYDGSNIRSLTVKPWDKVVLPEIPGAGGLKLYGFAYAHTHGNFTIYRGQITSVPNVSQMRLDALWVDYDQTFTKIQPVRAGMVFVGWLRETDGLTGVILSGSEVETGMEVYALWVKDEVNLRANTTALSFTFGGAEITAGAGAGIIISVLAVAAAIFAVAVYASYRKANKKASVSSTANSVNKISAAQNRVNKADVRFTAPETVRRKALPFGVWIKRRYISIIPCFLCLIFVFGVVYNLLYTASCKVSSDKANAERQAAVVRVYEENSRPSDNYFKAVSAEAASGANVAGEEVDDLPDDEAFLLANVYLNLLSLGYDVFPAKALKADGKSVNGFAYCSYDEVYEKDGSNKLYVGCGFLPVFGEPQITQAESEAGIEIIPYLDEGEIMPEYGFLLTFEETFGPIHYIAYGKYVKYSVKNFTIEYTVEERYANCIDYTIGYLYDYDLEQPVYDPDTGSEEKPRYDAYSLVQGIDYDEAYNSAKGMIACQDDNFLTVSTFNVLYISKRAINDYLVHGQDESYLDIPAEELQRIEAQLDGTLFYYVDENNEVQLAEIPPDPEPDIFKIITSVAQITLGAILIVTGAGTAAGILMIAGGVLGLVSDKLSEVVSGIGTVSNGINCLLMGLQLFACGPVGWVAGTIMVGTGAATTIFGINDIATAVTGHNLIQELTGMSDKAYYWTEFGLNLASTVFAVTAGVAKSKGWIRCFAAGTGVLTVTAGGAIAKTAIEEIKAGDRVITYNEDTGKTEVKTVLETYESLHEEAVKVTHSGGQQITSSVGHRYYTQRGWISAEDLRAGDILQLVNGETVVVEQVQHELLENPQPLYNFAVEDNHNYYVAENVEADVYDFVLTHNKNCGNDFEPIDPAKFEVKYKLKPNTYHLLVKKKIMTYNTGKIRKIVGKNPNVALSANGDIALVGVGPYKGKSVPLGKNILEILAKLSHGKL